jgi:hypothetical protein
VTRTADGAVLPYEESQYGVPRGDDTIDFIVEDIRIQRASGR